MTGICPPNIRTAPIWRITLKVSLMWLALNSLKLSAQSPPWRRKAFPMAASASLSSKLLASPAKTMGGNDSMVCSTEASSSLSGYSGSCNAFFDFQLSTLHFPAAAELAGLAAVREVFVGSAAWIAEMGWWECLVVVGMEREKLEGCWWVWVIIVSYNDLEEREYAVALERAMLNLS